LVAVVNECTALFNIKRLENIFNTHFENEPDALSISCLFDLVPANKMYKEGTQELASKKTRLKSQQTTLTVFVISELQNPGNFTVETIHNSKQMQESKNTLSHTTIILSYSLQQTIQQLPEQRSHI
jgi:hypothetical protein